MVGLCLVTWPLGCQIPPFFFTHFTAEARFQGPQMSVFVVESRWLGSVHMVFSFTPKKPFLQVICFPHLS